MSTLGLYAAMLLTGQVCAAGQPDHNGQSVTIASSVNITLHLQHHTRHTSHLCELLHCHAHAHGQLASPEHHDAGRAGGRGRP
jgi:hypothetical protein